MKSVSHTAGGRLGASRNPGSWYPSIDAVFSYSVACKPVKSLSEAPSHRLYDMVAIAWYYCSGKYRIHSILPQRARY